MTSLSVQQLSDILHGKILRGDGNLALAPCVSTDSRKITENCIFFALSGEKFDGNNFAAQASQQGAGTVIVTRDITNTAESCAVIQVEDTLLALQQLATWWRNQLEDLRVVGITGSSGKTSVKDLTKSVLEQAFSITATQGNLNNHIGVPISILNAEQGTQVAIWEMGMNHAGELAPLCEMIQPQVGLISSIGTAHIEFLGSKEAIAQEKATLCRSLPPTGVLVIPDTCDFSELLKSSTQARCITAGINRGDIQAQSVSSTTNGASFRLVIPGFCDELVHLPLLGEHMIVNALLAAGAGWTLGLSPTQIKQGIESVSLTGARLHCIHRAGITIIDDTYNANLESMTAALRTLQAMPCTGTRWAILGAMGELGEFSEEAHRRVGIVAAELNIDHIVSVGDTARGISDSAIEAGHASVYHFPSIATAEQVTSLIKPGDIILIKGSRSAGMEQFINLYYPASL